MFKKQSNLLVKPTVLETKPKRISKISRNKPIYENKNLKNNVKDSTAKFSMTLNSSNLSNLNKYKENIWRNYKGKSKKTNRILN